MNQIIIVTTITKIKSDKMNDLANKRRLKQIYSMDFKCGKSYLPQVVVITLVQAVKTNTFGTTSILVESAR